jgi:NAD-dependent deacetylase
MDNDAVKAAAALLRQSSKTVALTGAGASTESGIPDFRGKNGLWSRYDPFEYGTLGAFINNPAKIWSMLAELLDVVDAEPNAGHIGLARLEEMELLAGIITQNIDSLHHKGGSKNVVEFHGSFETFTCLGCSKKHLLQYVRELTKPPQCKSCGEVLKPDIVFFDEMISESVLQETQELLTGTELLMVAGTSCQVQPAARIPYQVQSSGGRIIEINLEPALYGLADISLTGSFAAVMEELVSQLEQ